MGYVHGIRWTDEKVREEIFKVKNALGINRMPSRSEIEMVTGSSRLTNKISRTGGFYKWAIKLNLAIKSSETYLGKRYEGIASGLLAKRGYKVEQMTVRHPYDLLVDDCIKIDIKVGKPYKNQDISIYHTFNLEKKNATCDIYMIFALNEDETLDRLLIIPSKNLKVRQLSIGKKSGYNIYENRWDYISKFKKFYSTLD